MLHQDLRGNIFGDLGLGPRYVPYLLHGKWYLLRAHRDATGLLSLEGGYGEKPEVLQEMQMAIRTGKVPKLANEKLTPDEIPLVGIPNQLFWDVIDKTSPALEREKRRANDRRRLRFAEDTPDWRL